jgi:opacity protein-like surface antigen
MKRTLAVAVALSAALAAAPTAHADQVGYLVNVTVRPGYNFGNADDALSYGYGICDRVAAKTGYAQLVDEVKRDVDTADYYQGAYLINEAVEELCPAQIWQLRQSAGGYPAPA